MSLLGISLKVPRLYNRISIRQGPNICLGCIENIRSFTTRIRVITTEDTVNSSKDVRSQEIAGWIKQSLFEHNPIQKSSQCGSSGNPTKTTNTVDKKQWEKKWKVRFQNGRIQCVNDVIILKKKGLALFTTSQLLVLLTSLSKLQLFYDIDRVYQVYRSELENAETSMNDKQELFELLKIMILTESRLHNYDVVALFFRKYIKQPNLHPTYINMGLKALLENNDFITARQFFEHMLNKQDVFPVTHRTLQILLTYINHSDDLLALKTVFESWLQKGPSLPNKDSISLVHKQFLKFDEENSNKYWRLLLSHPRLQETKYEKSDRYAILELMRKFKNNLAGMEEVNALLKNISPEEKSYLYWQVLDRYVEQDNYEMLKLTMDQIKDDPEVTVDQHHHASMLKYFAKTGSLGDFINYVKMVRESSPESLTFNPFLFFQLWECAFQAHPVLRENMEKKMKKLCNHEWYKRTYPWLVKSVESQVFKRTETTSGDDTFSRRNEKRVDTKLLKRLQNILRGRRYRRAKSIILDQARLGIRPNFPFYYTLKKFCVNNGHLPMSNMLDNTLRSTYRIIPVKVSILNLRHNLYRLAYQLRKTNQSIEVVRQSSLKLIDGFVKHHSEKLNFQNYLQLGMLASRYQGRYLCDKMYSKAIQCRDPSDARATYMLYRSLLAYFVRSEEPKKYLSTLRKLNKEPHFILTKYLLNTVKYNIAYFDRKSSDNTDAMLIEFVKLRERYAFIKLEGLDAIKELMTFLKAWLSHESLKQKKLTHRKQLELRKRSKTTPS